MIKYSTNDELVADFLFMYCEGKSFLWRMFFGWRMTKKDVYVFLIPNKAIIAAEEWASTIRGRVERGEDL